MPEFILDHGNQETAKAFAALDSFTQGYIEAMFFTDTEHNSVREAEPDSRDRQWNPETDSNLPGDVSFADLAPETLARIIADCQRFQTAHAPLLEQAAELEPGSESFRYARNTLDDRRLGQLFWYARNGHGVAFTDDGNATCLHALQDACGFGTAFSTVDSCVGDDGLIYLS